MDDYIPIQNALPDMVIAKDVVDQNEHVLLPEGTVLTSTHIQSLIKRGITQICIQLTEATAIDHSADLLRQRERLDQLFHKTSHFPINSLLKSYVMQYREEKTNE
ncbi:hypothetical protein LPB67_06970 [Undibacterium sp. Jales W-56]|uniref:hypothetical protein n=1 Tax=Undibacterium sp. Jales W-56 TaxID=2897325 RepID=UPI0021D266F3|nr:hypothetical protein [Undibacterium sp. Jales W-56]MCU6433520.1 hypothetical protein [Undibacterium sp. Jales W-56]